MAEVRKLGGIAFDSDQDLGIRTVAIGYDADNGFGASMRSSTTCIFQTRAGAIDETLLCGRVEMAKNAANSFIVGMQVSRTSTM